MVHGNGFSTRTKYLLNQYSSRRQAKSDLSKNTCIASASSAQGTYEKRKEEHRKMGIQGNRQYRRLKIKSNKSWVVNKSIAEKYFELDAAYISNLISARRRLVKAYVKKRHLNAILRLIAGNIPFTKIAPVVKLIVNNVKRMYREHNATQNNGDFSSMSWMKKIMVMHIGRFQHWPCCKFKK